MLLAEAALKRGREFLLELDELAQGARKGADPVELRHAPLVLSILFFFEREPQPAQVASHRPLDAELRLLLNLELAHPLGESTRPPGGVGRGGEGGG